MQAECEMSMILFSKFMRKWNEIYWAETLETAGFSQRERDVFEMENWAVAMVMEPSPSATGGYSSVLEHHVA